jgi:hypothetical protein
MPSSAPPSREHTHIGTSPTTWKKRELLPLRGGSSTRAFFWGLGTPLGLRPSSAPPSREHTRIETSLTTWKSSCKLWIGDRPFFSPFPFLLFHYWFGTKEF